MKQTLKDSLELLIKMSKVIRLQSQPTDTHKINNQTNSAWKQEKTCCFYSKVNQQVLLLPVVDDDDVI